MGLGPAETDRLSYWKYQALVWTWNKRHQRDDGEGDPVEAPSAELVEHRHMLLAERGLGKMVH